MALDRTTDAIAHFAGEFALLLEQARLRFDYNSFETPEVENPERELAEAVQVRLKAPHKLEGFKPGLDLSDQPPVPLRGDGPDSSFAPSSPPPPGELNDMRPMLLDFPNASAFGGAFSLGALDGVIITPLPSQVASVTFQFNVLHDGDLLVNVSDWSFVDPAYFSDVLAELSQTAQGFSIQSLLTDLSLIGADAAALRAFAEEFRDAEVEDRPGLTTYKASGEAAAGITVNGAAADEIPSWADNLPYALRPEDERSESTVSPAADEADTGTEEGSAGSSAAVAGSTTASDSEGALVPTNNGGGDTAPADPAPQEEPFSPFYDPKETAEDESPFGVDAGHELIAGANQVTNEAFIVTSMIDAPVIAVAGAVVQFDAVSQVNLLLEDPVAASQAAGYGAVGDATRAPDAASRLLNAANISAVSSESETDEAEADAGGLGPQFVDLVRLEGDLLVVNEIRQHNFVSDDDRVDFSFTAASTFVGVGGNEVANLTSLLEYGFNYDLILIGGEMYSVNIVSQINVLLDFDVTHNGAFDAEAEDDEEETAPGHSTGDNLLLNQVEVIREGIDTFVEMTEDFAAALVELAEGATELAAEIAQNALFEGTEVLRALYIDGDLKIQNRIDQENVVGDADQVKTAMQEFVEEFGSGATVVTGSNALMNAASIQTFGLDSVVHTEDGAYSDLMLHQAGLVEEIHEAEEVDAVALAAEAVAFLAEGMLTPEVNESPMLVSDFDAGMPSADVMQTMLA